MNGLRRRQKLLEMIMATTIAISWLAIYERCEDQYSMMDKFCFA